VSPIKRKPIIISILFFLGIVIGFAAIYVNNGIMTSKELPVQHLEQTNINQANIGTYISSNHEYWNNELCWGRSEKYSFVVFQKHYNEYIEDLNQIINAVEDKGLRADFIHVQELLKNASETEKIDSLIDVHRVFHDLDVKFNGYSSSDYFGITQYGEKH